MESVTELNSFAMMAQIMGLAGKAGGPDTMMLGEALWELDQEQVIQVMHTELVDHIE